MESLSEITAYPEGTIFANPLFIPNKPIFEIDSSRKGFFGKRKNEISIPECGFLIEQTQSRPGLWTAYNPLMLKKASVRDVKCIIIGILGEDEEQIGEDFSTMEYIDMGIDKNFLEEVTYNDFYGNIIDSFCDADMDPIITGQIEEILHRIESLGVVDNEVYSITPEGKGKVLFIPDEKSGTSRKNMKAIEEVEQQADILVPQEA